MARPCDLIIAAANAEFSEPVVNLGIGGVEYHGHTWDREARKAKEILFTGRAIAAEEVQPMGMVARVVPLTTYAQRHEPGLKRSRPNIPSRFDRPSAP